MIENKLNFFFRYQILHLGGTIILFYIGAQLVNFDNSIKDTIGLRLQERLTKEQAKFVASCRSIHRDISLNF